MEEKPHLPVLLADDFPPKFGGIQRYMRCLADALHSLGRDVVVIAPDCGGAKSYDAQLPYLVVRYRGTSRLERTARILGSSVMTKTDYTVAALWFPSGLAASFVPPRVRGGLGILIHGTDVLKPRGIARGVMRRVLAKADVVIANSSYTRRLAVSVGVARHITVVPCGVEDFAVRGSAAVVPTVLAVGRLVRRKGFDHLIEAMAIVLQTLPNAICEIVGDGPERDALVRLADRLGVSHAVRFLGPVADAELYQAYARAWCFALPVRRYGNDVEGFGLVYLEAAIAALPAIGGRDSGAAEAIVDAETGIIVDGRDCKEIARAVLTLLRDREFAGEMGRLGRARALREFTWLENARRIDDAMTALRT